MPNLFEHFQTETYLIKSNILREHTATTSEPLDRIKTQNREEEDNYIILSNINIHFLQNEFYYSILQRKNALNQQNNSILLQENVYFCSLIEQRKQSNRLHLDTRNRILCSHQTYITTYPSQHCADCHGT